MKKEQKIEQGTELVTHNFWRLFHAVLKQAENSEETARSKAAWEWMSDNIHHIRKSCVDIELDLFGIIYKLGRELRELPSYELVKEKVQVHDHNEGMIEALKEYETMRSEFSVLKVSDLPSILNDKGTETEQSRWNSILKIAQRITAATSGGGIELGKRKYSGTRDSINFLMNEMEKGVLIQDDGTSGRSIVVQKEAEEVGPFYDESMKRGFLPTGFPQFQLFHGDFFGILGYTGDGKSTVGRFMLYHIAEQGHNCVEITIENDAEVERNKFVLLHAHNPKFEGEFHTLSYEAYKQQRLTASERDAIDFVAKDFKEHLGGFITIQKPQEASWASCKNKIEMVDLTNPIEAAFIDYPQLIDPPAYSSDERRSKMTSMIKEIRQYGLTFGGSNRKLSMICPVQSNETGYEIAQGKEGVWTLSGVNNDKEFARSMNIIIGVYNKSRETGNSGHQLVFSSVKDRDAEGFKPFFMHLSPCGWISPDPVAQMNFSEIISDEDSVDKSMPKID